MLSSGGMNFSLYVGLSAGTGGGTTTSLTGLPGTSILMLKRRRCLSISSDKTGIAVRRDQKTHWTYNEAATHSQ